MSRAALQLLRLREGPSGAYLCVASVVVVRVGPWRAHWATGRTCGLRAAKRLMIKQRPTYPLRLLVTGPWMLPTRADR
eukprot:1072289-Prymnesium_polylepis.1